MSYIDLERSIRTFAEDANGNKVLESRRIAMRELSTAAKELLDNKEDLPRRRRDISFTVNQGKVKNGSRKKKFLLNVEKGGINIGHIEYVKKAEGYKEPSYRYFPKDEKGHPGWVWSKDASDAKEINEHFKKIGEKLKESRNKIQEREIQWQMFSAIENKNTDKEKGVFKNLRPVALAGFPCEIPTWINAKGEPATGNIDALIRRSGGSKGASYFVFELKRPNKNVVKPEGALRQAIIYAIGLSIEANGNEERQKAYRALFEGSKQAELIFGAVAVVGVEGKIKPQDKAAAQLALKKYAPKPLDANTPPLVVTVRVLLYAWDVKGKRITDWEWVDRA